MAGYQPISMPNFQGFGIADAVREMRDRQRQERLDTFNQMIKQGEEYRAGKELELQQQQQKDLELHRQHAEQQANQDRNAGIATKIQDLHNAGLSYQAQQLASIYGLQQQPTEQVTGPRVGQLYDNADFAATAKQALAGGPKQVGEPLQEGYEGPAEAPSPEEQGEGHAVGADPVATALKQFQPHQVYQYSGPGGLSFSVDPQQQEQEQLTANQHRAEQFKQAFQSVPGLQGYAQEFAARSQLGEDPKAVFADLTARQKADAETARKAAGEPAHSAARFEQEKELARIHAARRAGGAGGGGGGGAEYQKNLAELVQMKVNGADDGAIALRAAELRIPSGGKNGWLAATGRVKREGNIDFRQHERTAGLEATDAQGNVIGEWKSPDDARKMNTQTAQFSQLKERLSDLLADIEQKGDRALTPADTQWRNTLFDMAAAAGRLYNGLGATDSSQKLEQEILSARGTLGHGWVIGANRQIIQHLLSEAQTQHDARLKLRLRSQGATPAAGGGGDAKLTLAQEALDDPKAPPAVKERARQILHQAGH